MLRIFLLTLLFTSAMGVSHDWNNRGAPWIHEFMTNADIIQQEEEEQVTPKTTKSKTNDAPVVERRSSRNDHTSIKSTSLKKNKAPWGTKKSAKQEDDKKHRGWFGVTREDLNDDISGLE